MQSRNAISNLINRYRAVLAKCNLLNTFGSLAIAFMFSVAPINVAFGAPVTFEGSGSIEDLIGMVPTVDTSDTYIINPDLAYPSPGTVIVTVGSTPQTLTGETGAPTFELLGTGNNTKAILIIDNDLTLESVSGANSIVSTNSNNFNEIVIEEGKSLTSQEGALSTDLTIQGVSLTNNGDIVADKLSFVNLDFTQGDTGSITASEVTFSNVDFSGTNIPISGDMTFTNGMHYGGELVLENQTLTFGGTLDATLDDQNTIDDLTMNTGSTLVVRSQADSGLAQVVTGALTANSGSTIRNDLDRASYDSVLSVGSLDVNDGANVGTLELNVGRSSGNDQTINVAESLVTDDLYVGSSYASTVHQPLRASYVNIAGGKTLEVNNSFVIDGENLVDNILSYNGDPADPQLTLNHGKISLSGEDATDPNNVIKSTFKADSLWIGDGEDDGTITVSANGNLVSTGNLTIEDGTLQAANASFEGKTYQVGGNGLQNQTIESGTITVIGDGIDGATNADVKAGTITNNGGTLNFGKAGETVGSNVIDANITSTGSTGQVNVQGTWSMADGKDLTVNANKLSVGENSVIQDNNLTFEGSGGQNLNIHETAEVKTNTLTVINSVSPTTPNDNLTVQSGKLTVMGDNNAATNDIEAGLITVSSNSTLNLDSDPLSAQNKINSNITSLTGNIIVDGAWEMGADKQLTVNASRLDVKENSLLKDDNLVLQANGVQNLGATGSKGTVETNTLTVQNLDDPTRNELSISGGILQVNGDGLAYDPSTNIHDVNATDIIVKTDGTLNLGSATVNTGGSINSNLSNTGGNINVNGMWVASAGNTLTTGASFLNVGTGSYLGFDDIIFEENGEQTLDDGGTIAGKSIVVNNTSAALDDNNLNISAGTLEVHGDDAVTNDIEATNINISGGSLNLGDSTAGATALDNNIVNSNLNTSSTGEVNVNLGTWSMGAGKVYTGSANNLNVAENATFKDDLLIFTDVNNQELDGFGTVETDKLIVDTGADPAIVTPGKLTISNGTLQVNGTAPTDEAITADELIVNSSLTLGSNGGIANTDLTTNVGSKLTIDGDWIISGNLTNNSGLNISKDDSLSVGSTTLDADDFLDNPDAMNNPVTPTAGQISMEENSTFHADNLTLQDADAPSNDQTLNLNKGQLVSTNNLDVNASDGSDGILNVENGKLLVSSTMQDGSEANANINGSNIVVNNGQLELKSSTDTNTINTSLETSATGTGSIDVTDGTWNVNDGKSITNAGTLNVFNGSTLNVNNTTSGDFNSTGTLNITGDDGNVDSSAKIYSNVNIAGNANVSGNNLNIGAGNSLNVGSSLNFNDTGDITLDDAGSITAAQFNTNQKIIIDSTGSITVNGDGNVSSDIVANGLEIKSGSLSLGSAIITTGGTIASDITSTGGQLNVNNGTWEMDNTAGANKTYIGSANNLNVAENATFKDDELTFTDVNNQELDGKGTVETGKLIVTNGTTSSDLTISNGTLKVLDTDQASEINIEASNIILANDGKLDLQDSDTSLNDVNQINANINNNSGTINVQGKWEMVNGTDLTTSANNLTGAGSGNSIKTDNLNFSSADDQSINFGGDIIANTVVVDDTDAPAVDPSTDLTDGNLTIEVGRLTVLGDSSVDGVSGDVLDGGHDLQANNITLEGGVLNLGNTSTVGNNTVDANFDNKNGTINVNGTWVMQDTNSITTDVDKINVNSGSSIHTGSLIFKDDGADSGEFTVNGTISANTLNVQDKNATTSSLNIGNGTLQVNGTAPSNASITATDININGGNLNLGSDVAISGGIVNSNITTSGSGALNVNGGTWSMDDASLGINKSYTGSANNLNVAENAIFKDDVLTFTDTGDQLLDGKGTVETNNLTVAGGSNNLTVENGKLQVNGDDDLANADITATNITINGVDDTTKGSLELGSKGGIISSNLSTSGTGELNVTAGAWEMDNTAGANKTYNGSADNLNVASGATFKDDNLTFTGALQEQTLDGAGKTELDTLKVIQDNGIDPAQYGNLNVTNGNLVVNGNGIADNDIEAGNLNIGTDTTTANLDLGKIGGIAKTDITTSIGGTLNVNGDWTIDGELTNQGKTSINTDGKLNVGALNIDADLFETDPTATSGVILNGGTFHANSLTLQESNGNDTQTLDIQNNTVSANTVDIKKADGLTADDLTISSGSLSVLGDSTTDLAGAIDNGLTDLKGNNIVISGGELNLGDSSSLGTNTIEANIDNQGGKINVNGNWVMADNTKLTTATKNLAVESTSSIHAYDLTFEDAGDQTLTQGNISANMLTVEDSSTTELADGNLTINSSLTIIDNDAVDTNNIQAGTITVGDGIVNAAINLQDNDTSQNDINTVVSHIETKAGSSLNVQSGSWSVSGTLTNNGMTVIGDGVETAKLDINSNLTIEASKLVDGINPVSDGQIAVKNQGTLEVDNLTLQVTDTENTLNTGGTVASNNLIVDNSGFKGDLIVSGGTLNIIDNDLNNLSNVTANKVTVNGGMLNLEDTSIDPTATEVNNIDSSIETVAGSSFNVGSGSWSISGQLTNNGITEIGNGIEIAKLDINSDLSIETSKLVNGAGIVSDGQIAVNNQGTLEVDNLALQVTDTENNLNTGGTVAADTLFVNNNLNITGGALQVYGTLNENSYAVLVGTVLNPGTINNSSSIILGHSSGSMAEGGILGSNLVNNAGASLEIVSGSWKTVNGIDVQGGDFSIASGANLDITSGTLAVANTATSFDNAGTLEAKAEVFGNFNGNIASFADNANTKTLNNTGLVKLHDTGLNEVAFNDLKALQTSGLTDAAGNVAITGGGSIGLVGVNISELDGVNLGSLSGYYLESDETVEYGDLTGNSDITIAGITGNGDSSVGAGSSLTLTGKHGGALVEADSTKTFTNNGTTTLGMENGDADFGDAKLQNNSLLNILGNLSIKTLANDGIMNIGDENVASRVEVDSMSGVGVVFVDPAWDIDPTKNTLATASNLVLRNPTNASLTNTVGVGRNAYMAHSARAISELEQEFYDAKMNFGNGIGDITAALFLDKPIVTDTTGTNAGYLRVDGALVAATAAGIFTDSAGTAHDGAGTNKGNIEFGRDSLLMINMSNMGSNTALTAANDVIVDSGAKLLLTDVGALATGVVGSGVKTVSIANAGGTVSLGTDAWGNGGANTIYFDSIFLDGTTSNITGSTIDLTISQVSAASVLPNIDSGLAKHIDQAIFTGVDSAGMDFVKDASLLYGRDPNINSSNIIESAAKVATLSGVYGNMSNVNDVAQQNITDRVSFGKGMMGHNYILEGASLWMSPMYKSSSAKDYKSGNYEYGFDGDLYGMSVGGDYTLPTNLKLGLAFHMGAGDSKSNGELARTENDYDYLGVSAYAAYLAGDVGLSADIGYTNFSNDVNQKNTLGNLKGDFDSSIFTIGARAEYPMITDVVDVIPYIGARINHYSVEKFNTKLGSNAIFKNKQTDATTFEIPVGVVLKKDYETKNGYMVTPSLDLGAKFAMGDTDIEQKVNIAGSGGSANMDVEVLDKVSAHAGLGLGITKNNISFELDYDFDVSPNMTNHGVMATIKFKF